MVVNKSIKCDIEKSKDMDSSLNAKVIAINFVLLIRDCWRCESIIKRKLSLRFEV